MTHLNLLVVHGLHPLAVEIAVAEHALVPVSLEGGVQALHKQMMNNNFVTHLYSPLGQLTPPILLPKLHPYLSLTSTILPAFQVIELLVINREAAMDPPITVQALHRLHVHPAEGA